MVGAMPDALASSRVGRLVCLTTAAVSRRAPRPDVESAHVGYIRRTSEPPPSPNYRICLRCTRPGPDSAHCPLPISDPTEREAPIGPPIVGLIKFDEYRRFGIPTLRQQTRMPTLAIIGGVTGTLARPESLLLGRFDTSGRLRYTGRTTVLTELQSTQLSTTLTAAPPGGGTRIAHPWPQPLPAAWTGQFDKTEPVRYLQVQPTTVAQISVDTAFEHQRWRHMVRHELVRAELSTQDVPVLRDQ
jgi:hypothetical protein